MTFTGDFFHKDNKGLKKTSNNDSENNFYKAQQQITDAVCAVVKNNEGIAATEETPNHLIPLIITNAQIWVVDYEKDPVNATSHKWVKHKVRSNPALQLHNNTTLVHTYLAHVVNINYLSEFLEKANNMNRSYGTVDSLNNTLIEA